MILTGTTAALFFGGTRIGKCRDISLSIDREALPTTKQGDLDRTFISGLRSTSGSASLFYDPEDAATDALLTQVYADNSTLSGVEMVFDSATGKKVTASAVITRVGLSASFGAAQVCDIDFQISGKPTAAL
jgi:hypothetical protein